MRYREFESLTHLNQLAEQWLREEADQRLHGTVKEVVAERFVREWPHLQAVARHALRYGLSRTPGGGVGRLHRGARQPLQRAGRTVRSAGRSAHRTRRRSWQFIMAQANWSRGIGSSPRPKAGLLGPEHHRILWEQALTVERRALAVYEEVAQWS